MAYGSSFTAQGQASGGLAGAQAGRDSMGDGSLKPNRRLKEQLLADYKTLQTNPDAFGLSDGERSQMVSEATEAGNTQRQAQTTQLSRDALAGQDFQRGAFVDAQRAVADTAGQEAATASVEANKLSKALQEQEKARILGDMDKRAQINREQAQYWAQFGLDSVEAVASIAKSAGWF